MKKHDKLTISSERHVESIRGVFRCSMACDRTSRDYWNEDASWHGDIGRGYEGFLTRNPI